MASEPSAFISTRAGLHLLDVVADRDHGVSERNGLRTRANEERGRTGAGHTSNLRRGYFRGTRQSTGKPVISALKCARLVSTACVFLAALALTGCFRTSPAAEENAKFLAELKTVVDAESYNSLSTALAWMNSLEGRSGILPGIARDLFELEAAGRSQAWASNQVWLMVSLEGFHTSHQPAKSLFGRDWKPGFYIIPHLEPAPAKYSVTDRVPIPLDTCLVLRFVPTEVAEKTKYTVARPR